MSIMKDFSKYFESTCFTIERKYCSQSIISFASLDASSNLFENRIIWRTTRFESHCFEENLSQCSCRYDEVDCERSIWQSNDACNETLMFIASKMFKFRNVESHTKHDSLYLRVNERKDDWDLNVHLNQQAIDLFVNIVETNAIQDNVNISLWNARDSTLK